MPFCCTTLCRLQTARTEYRTRNLFSYSYFYLPRELLPRVKNNNNNGLECHYARHDFMLKHMRPTQRDRQAVQPTTRRPIITIHWNGGYLPLPGHRTGRGDWKIHHQRRHIRFSSQCHPWHFKEEMRFLFKVLSPPAMQSVAIRLYSLLLNVRVLACVWLFAG